MRLSASGKDEIADLAHKFNAFMEKLQSMIKEVTMGVETLSASSGYLREISVEMTHGSEHTSAKSNTVAAASEEMSANMNSVAAAMEQSSANTDTVTKAAQCETLATSCLVRCTRPWLIYLSRWQIGFHLNIVHLMTRIMLQSSYALNE